MASPADKPEPAAVIPLPEAISRWENEGGRPVEQEWELKLEKRSPPEAGDLPRKPTPAPAPGR